MWNVKAKLIAVIRGVTGTISESLRQYPSNYQESMNYKEQAILHSRGSANVKVQSIFHMQNNITYCTKCVYITAATLCTLETWFVLGI